MVNQLENDIRNRNEALYALFTDEDVAVWHHIAHRMGNQSLWRLGQTVMAGRADINIMLDLVEDTMYLLWSERQRAEDELLDQQRWDAQDMEAAQYDCDLS